MPLFRRFMPAFCWFTTAVLYVLALLPGEMSVGVSAWDKINHALAFFVLANIARVAYPRHAAIRLFVLLAAFGGLIEISQAVPIIHRDAEWNDWFVDMVAAAIGLLVATPFAFWLNARSVPAASDAA